MAIEVQMTTQLKSGLCYEHGTTDTHFLSCLEKEKKKRNLAEFSEMDAQ